MGEPDFYPCFVAKGMPYSHMSYLVETDRRLGA
jgi:hypothetical protein